MSLRRLAAAVPGPVRASATDLRTVLAFRHVPQVAATSLVARLPKGMVPLATVLLLHQISGSYAIAGITAALVAAGDAASTPVQGRLVDRLGRGWVLIPTAAVHVAAVAALLVLARTGAPVAVAICATVAGIGMPPVSGCIKAVWPQLVGQDHLAAAYTVESLLQQVIFLSGPLLVAAVTVAISAAAALACSAAMVAAGTVGFVIAAATAAPEGGTPRNQHVPGAWRVPAVRILTYSTVLQSLTFGALPVGLAAVTADAGHPDLAGVLLATLTAGGVIGTFGPRATADRRRYAQLAAGFAAALLAVAALSSQPSAAVLIAIGAALAAAGLFVTPLAATSYVLIEKTTAAAHRTEAFAWLSTGQAAGNAAGAAVAGVLIGTAGPGAGLGLLPVAVGLTAALIGRSRLPAGRAHRSGR
jgi:MFS family permease